LRSLPGRAARADRAQQARFEARSPHCPIGRLAVAAEVLQYLLNDVRILDTGGHPQLPAAAPADLDVNGSISLTSAECGTIDVAVGIKPLPVLLVSWSGPVAAQLSHPETAACSRGRTAASEK
jgi:hypothetical protein